MELYPYVHMILELREEPAAERKNLSSANLWQHWLRKCYLRSEVQTDCNQKKKSHKIKKKDSYGPGQKPFH